MQTILLTYLGTLCTIPFVQDVILLTTETHWITYADKIVSPGIGVIEPRKASVVILSCLATFTKLLISPKPFNESCWIFERISYRRLRTKNYNSQSQSNFCWRVGVAGRGQNGGFFGFSRITQKRRGSHLQFFDMLYKSIFLKFYVL